MSCRLLTAILVCLVARAAFAEPLLLRFETVGFENARQKTEKPKQIRSLEVVTEPGSVFFARTTMGKETFLISGTLKPAGQGGFELHLRNSHSKKQTDGKPTSTSSQGPIQVQLGKRVVVSGVESTRQPEGGSKRHSLIQNAVTVTRFDPASLAPAKKASR